MTPFKPMNPSRSDKEKEKVSNLEKQKYRDMALSAQDARMQGGRLDAPEGTEAESDIVSTKVPFNKRKALQSKHFRDKLDYVLKYHETVLLHPDNPNDIEDRLIRAIDKKRKQERARQALIPAQEKIDIPYDDIYFEGDEDNVRKSTPPAPKRKKPTVISPVARSKRIYRGRYGETREERKKRVRETMERNAREKRKKRQAAGMPIRKSVTDIAAKRSEQKQQGKQDSGKRQSQWPLAS